MKNKFIKYLKSLGYSEHDISEGMRHNTFTHSTGTNDLLSVKYILTPTSDDVFESHKLLWNKNADIIFIAVSDKATYLINVREKPDKNKPLKSSICISSFNYGINSEGYENVDIELISKSHVDSAYFFDFVSKHQRKANTVDKDLLLNLLALKSDLIKSGNEKIIYLLILRCLFIKYLEDRKIFDENYLLNILKSKNPEKLLEAFEEVTKINGDVFKFDKFDENSIKVSYLKSLASFFETDYRKGQLTLFPYQFDQIPIQLISHVYEAFLKGSIKKGKGIYYTPPFLVNFMLAQSLAVKVKANPKAKVLDPAVGSGAFLVQSFRIIQEASGPGLDFDAKKKILEEQLFGIDNDKSALQIAAFSLYLALLETESSEFIKQEIKRANPILPSLIGKTLCHNNALVDSVFENKYFDCIVSNPPWGSVPSEDTKDNRRERVAIDNNSQYRHVSDYERSQAFLMKVRKWCNKDTVLAMVVKNSIFLNEKAKDFRRDVLEKYQLNTFYELSHYNKILFKKTVIGEISGEKIELGASEPCVVLLFELTKNKNNYIQYISPKLTSFSEHFDIILHTGRDEHSVKKSAFIENDGLWRVLVKGDLEDYELIMKLKKMKHTHELICSKGLEPQEDNKSRKTAWFRELISSEDFDRYIIKHKTTPFDYNQKLRRPGNPELYSGERILIANRPKPNDNFHLRGVFVSNDLIFRNDISGLKFGNGENIKPYIGLINSSLFGYFLFQESVQWQGGAKRDSLRIYEILQLPFLDLKLHPSEALKITKKIDLIEREPQQSTKYEKDIDDLIFDLYGLLDYEKEIIREFYQIRVERASEEDSMVRVNDIKKYFEVFKETFSLILSKQNSLNASFYISPNIGATICLSIVGHNNTKEINQQSELQVLNFVKSKQLKKADALKILNEDKVKIYDKDKFYIIKSNQFKDWTVRQAMKDAREEVEIFIKHLSEKE